MKAILLVLSRDQFSEECLPASLRRLRHRGVTLVFDDGDLRSFKKLLPAIEMFPEDRIVTLDDDCFYPRDWVATLVAESERAPGAVVGHFGREMSLDEKGKLHHDGWPKANALTDPRRLFLIGCAGILYPAGSLAPIAFDRDVISATCPTEDDSWFFGCSVLAGAPRRTTSRGKAPRIAAADATSSLGKENAGGATDKQFQAVLDVLGIRQQVEVSLREE
jgi:hypothetical protein